MKMNELKTRDLGSPRGGWKIKLLLIVVFFLLCGVVAGGAYLYQKISLERAQRDFVLSQALYEKGQFVQAKESLLRLYRRYPSFSEREKLLFYLATIQQKDAPLASEVYWDSLLAEYPQGTHAPEALTCLAKIADASGDRALSQKRWEQLRADYPESEGAAYAELARADEVARSGNADEARKIYYKVIENSPPGPLVGEAMDRLSVINTDYLFSSVPNEWNQLVQIERGDSLLKLAYKYHTTASFIAKANGRDLKWSLVPKQRITVPKIDSYRIAVSKDDLYLYLHAGAGQFIKRYRVGIGRMDHLTPPGSYVIWHKLKSPPWHDRETGRIVKPDDPEYPLGTRWMTLGRADDPDAFSRLGIHGTNEPNTIGKRESDGCVRMLNEHVEELFIIVPKGTPVEIVEKGAVPASLQETEETTENSVLKNWIDPQIGGED